MTVLYTILTPTQQTLVDTKMTKKLKTTKVIIRQLLTTINPLVKVTGNQVLVYHETLKKLTLEVENYESRMQN